MMKRSFFLLFSSIVMFVVLTASEPTPQLKYIEKYSQIAVDEMHRSGVPASITLAQGILESDCGNSRLAREGNNHFGIKCHNDWTGKTMNKDDDAKGECFRVYSDASESFSDHSDFLRFRSRYQSLFDLDVTDYKSWAYGLKNAGYATDPQYPAKLIRIIEEYGLSRFDQEIELVPEAPSVLEEVIEYVPVNNRSSFTFSLSRKIYETNGVPFVYSVEGDSYQSLASAYNLFKKEILKFNDLKEEGQILPGTVVYLKLKKSKAAKGIDKYIVDADGEDLRDICQRYGVRLKSIEKLNKFDAGHMLREGDTIILR